MRLWVVALVLLLSSIWVGLQIGPKRDPISWAFILVLPLMILGVVVFVGGKKDSEVKMMRRELEEFKKRLTGLEKKVETLVEGNRTRTKELPE